jgi:hypothetical protein
MKTKNNITPYNGDNVKSTPHPPCIVTPSAGGSAKEPVLHPGFRRVT